MHSTIDDHQVEQDERSLGIAEDRRADQEAADAVAGSAGADPASPVAGSHLTTQARRLADLVVESFTADNPGHWQRVADSLTDDPEILDSFAAQHGLPRPIDAVKCRAIELVRSQALAVHLSPIPPASQRPVCVTVAWLAEHPTFAAQLEYLAGDTGWLPAGDAVHCIDPEWCVEVRQRIYVVGA